MNILNYTGLILSGVLFAVLVLTTEHHRKFRTSMQRKLESVHDKLTAAYHEIKRLGGPSRPPGSKS